MSLFLCIQYDAALPEAVKASSQFTCGHAGEHTEDRGETCWYQ